MKSAVLYSDSLVEITDEDILFRVYYFPVGFKRVKFEEIDSVTAEKPQLFSSMWRLWGAGDFHTWFPCDWYRPNRDAIFIMKLKTQSMLVGFTVENSDSVIKILKEKKLFY